MGKYKTVNYIFHLTRDGYKNKHWVLLYLNQIILKKMEEKLLNLNQLSHIFVIFMSSTSINMPV